MSEAEPRRGVGRPRDAAKVERVLDAAWELFLERGVEATAMETVAARAAVAKSTLYAAFPDRQALFDAVMLRAMLGIEAAQGLDTPLSPPADLRSALQAFGEGVMGFLASDPAVAFYGPLAAEIRRRPALSEAFWRLGPGRTRANLTALLAAARARGEIVLDDPQASADALFGMWQGFSPQQFVLVDGTARVRASVAERVAHGTALFLRAHGV